MTQTAFRVILLLAALWPVFAMAQGEPRVDGVPPTIPGNPAIGRTGSYMGFAERFNRHYTDPAYRPARIVFVSPNGSGSGDSRGAPASPRSAIAAAVPGTRIHFLRGDYSNACFELKKTNSGTYDAPVVLFGERNDDKTIGVRMNCCNSGRKACFNLEAADYVAIDGFELIGGDYGIRSVGAGHDASQHARGVAMLNSIGHDQNRDPFFTGQSDWAVVERNVAYGAKKGDGHGIYISNGSDWNIVRFNETHSNAFASDFQINADPESTCKEEGIPFDDPRCDAYAGEGEGGRGASDYFLIDSNYFHHSQVGPNFTSLRRSLIRNNIFGFQQRHNASFWQETDNPKLGSSENRIVHNLFITTGRHAVQFSNHSNRNEFANNIVLGVKIERGAVTANPSALLMEVDDTVGTNVYRSNLYVSGRIEGRKPGRDEIALAEFSPGWFVRFPTTMNHDANDFGPTAAAPFLGRGGFVAAAPSDRNGHAREGKVDLGPFEVRETAAASPPAAAPNQRAASAGPISSPSSPVASPVASPVVSPVNRSDARGALQGQLPAAVPHAVTVARTVEIPACTVFVDASAAAGGAGTVAQPHRTIGAAIDVARPGAVICVAEGIYREQLAPGEKYFTLAGGFQRGQQFKVRDSARFVSKAQGSGGSFVKYEDPAPKGDQLTAIDGFEITGYAQAVVRNMNYIQRFDLTNNHIHDNQCPDLGEQRIVGAGFALDSISGRIEANVFRNNTCGRGGAGFLGDEAKASVVTVARNLVDGNAGTQGNDSHGGAFYFFGKNLKVIGNLFTNNTVTGWGGGLYLGAWPAGGNFTNAVISWNVYRGNRAGGAGGGMFCDDSANCTSLHEIYDSNCGGNIYLDRGADKDPTISRFDHLTVVGGLDVDCKTPGPGMRFDVSNEAPDSHIVTNALFRGNSPDIAAGCDGSCGIAKVGVSHSMVDTNYVTQGVKVTFGEGIVTPADPLFADPAAGDFHLKSMAGRWTPAGHVQDPVSSPALAKGAPRGATNDNPERAGNRNELGAFGNSAEASYVR